MSTDSESPPRSAEERAKVIALDDDEYDLLEYVGTADAAVRGISEHYRLFVRYRNTEPKGWEVFVGYPIKAFINGTWDTVCARRKLLTQSFQTATAAAVAAQLHEGV